MRKEGPEPKILIFGGEERFRQSRSREENIDDAEKAHFLGNSSSSSCPDTGRSITSSLQTANMSTTSSPLLRTTLSLVLLQLVSRLFSFSLNQLLLRSTTPQALGMATMGLEVIRDTGLFLVREGVRGAVIVRRWSAFYSNEEGFDLQFTDA